MSDLHLHNSYTRQKEKFEALVPGHVGLYVCGPTVSGESHLGHARPYITFDIVYRYLRHLGYRVRYVRNITDAGHFEEEGREAEDKVSKKAQLERMEPMELVHKYTNLYHWGMHRFNCEEPSIEPTATGHIIEQINMIQDIIAKGYAYEVNGSVYFDVKKYAETYPYGKLSGRVLDDLLETTRDLEGQDEKRNKVDFALWKNAPPEHIMRWTSPWGEGFPGWHIECSAMSSKYLGETFDIHGGGMDLLFPHHESEIAQSTIAHGHAPVRYWMHNNMITINGKKMGKSYNNVIKLTELFTGEHPMLEQAYHPMVVRFYILQTHYRSTLDFSNEALQASERAFRRLWEAYEVLQELQHPGNTVPADGELDGQVRTWCHECKEFMDDDFNTAKVIANLFEMAPVINGIKGGQVAAGALSADTFALLQDTFKTYLVDILGMQAMQEQQTDKLDKVLALLIEMRKDARTRKDFATSDQIRNKLAEAGVLLKDEKDGTVSYTIE
ncbi:MAG: cysteine--tRNA ligase [Bacteroidetes bacterium 46-16]|nr:MAG: cysteine--tRNA ligase [Bacteroidetes bacterium 46-16]